MLCIEQHSFIGWISYSDHPMAELLLLQENGWICSLWSEPAHGEGVWAFWADNSRGLPEMAADLHATPLAVQQAACDGAMSALEQEQEP